MVKENEDIVKQVSRKLRGDVSAKFDMAPMWSTSGGRWLWEGDQEAFDYIVRNIRELQGHSNWSLETRMRNWSDPIFQCLAKLDRLKIEVWEDENWTYQADLNNPYDLYIYHYFHKERPKDHILPYTYDANGPAFSYPIRVLTP